MNTDKTRTHYETLAKQAAGEKIDVTTREQFVALIESRKSANLPKGMNYADRERAALVVKRAQGWLRSPFFRMESSETQQHVDALARVGGAQS